MGRVGGGSAAQQDPLDQRRGPLTHHPGASRSNWIPDPEPAPSLAPRALSDSTCTPTGGRLAACMILHNGRADSWSRQVSVEPGAVILAKVRIVTSEVEGDDLIVTLGSSDKFSWVGGALRFANSNTDGHWKTDQNTLQDPGVGLGDYAPGAAAYLNFAVQVSPESAFPCGTTTISIPLDAHSTAGSISTDASATVTRYC